MLKNDLIFRNPMRVAGSTDQEEILPPGGLGAVLARAGVGKTALLVQLALDSLLREKNVLHISLGDPVRKVCLWYEEVFRNIAAQYEITDRMDALWETILPHRLIMTFKAEDFSVPRLEARISDLAEQDIFLPQMILVDGMSFDGPEARQSLTDFKTMAASYGIHAWFTARTHRDAPADEAGVPENFAPVADLFHSIFRIQPEGKEIFVRLLKGGTPEAREKSLFLEPTTLLIRLGN